jgi:hypothetical protein
LPPEADLPAASPPPAEDWTDQERWIWDQTLAGEIADLNIYHHETEQLDPKQDAGWTNPEKPRLVREKFLLDVLGRKPYRDSIPWRGLRIIGACFPSDLDLQSLHIERQFWIKNSRFEGAVNLEEAKFDVSLSFEGSAFSQVLDMNGVTIRRDLFLSDGGYFAGEVYLVGAEVDGLLDARGATFERRLDMNGLTVGQSLRLERARCTGDVDLVGAKVEGQFNARGATFEAALNLNGATIRRNLSLCDAQFGGEVDLGIGKVEGQLDASGASFKAGLNMNSLMVGQILDLRRARAGDVDLVGAKVQGRLDASGASFEARLVMNSLTVGENLLTEGAGFAGDVDLRSAKIDGHLGASRATFAGKVDLGGAIVDGQLNAGGATFEGRLDMNGLTVGQNLILAGGAQFAGEVDLVGATVSGHLNANGATFEAGLVMDGLRVGQNLDLGGARFAGDVDLGSAVVNGQLNGGTATFEGRLDMNGLTVERGLFLRDDARFAGEVNLVGAKINGDFDASGAGFEARLNMDSVTVGQTLFVTRAIVAGKVSLKAAKVGAIDLGGATFRAPVDASGLAAEGELTLDPAPTWGHCARFLLRNARVGVLNDGGDPKTASGAENPWPARGELELDGFSYGRLLHPRTVHWYQNQWLARDTTYTPQPYQQLAGVLRATGDPSGANDVLYAARERERTEAGAQSLVGPKTVRLKAAFRWIGLSLLKWTMGYGLGIRYFLALFWVAGLTLIGAVVLWNSGEADQIQPIPRVEGPGDMGAGQDNLGDEARTALQHPTPPDRKTAVVQVEPKNRKGFLWCVFASLDWTLPLIELDRAHADTIAKLAGGPFYWLYVQAFIGYVLAGFLAAGLAGLTQSRG